MRRGVFRNAIGLLVGLLAGGIAVHLIERLSVRLYPPPAGMDFQNVEQVGAFVADLPAGAFALVLLAHSVGGFVAGLVCGLIVGKRWLGGGVALGVFFTAAGVANLVAIPHPLWFAILDTLIYLPTAVLGILVSVRLTSGRGPAKANSSA